MKKCIYILLFLSGFVFSQNHYEIQPKTTFDDTLTWVRVYPTITVNLSTQTASWQISGLKVVAVDTLSGLRHFKSVVNRTVTVNYTGQSITETAQKNATKAKFDLVYTGIEQ